MTSVEHYLKEKAAETEHTFESLSQAESTVIEVIQSNLQDHFKKCHLERGTDYWLLESSSGAWLAFTKYELRKQLDDADIEYTISELLSVAFAHLESFQSNGWTVEIPGPIARSHTDSLYFPIFVPFPDGWKEGEYHALQRFEEMVSRYDMSPAEALDYWATERMPEDAISWAGKRDVEPEAIRKNVRQAKEKFSTDGHGASHENSVLKVVSLDELPDGSPHNPDKDAFYVPTEESIEGVE